MKNKIQKLSGFTLIEILVSILILSTAIVGAFAMITFNFGTASLIRNNLIASGLAQEGIEVVRNIRDSKWLEGSTFNDALPPGKYLVAYDTLDLNFSASNDPPFIKKDSTGKYQYNFGKITSFTRVIIVKEVDNIINKDKERIVISLVSWDERGEIKKVEAEIHLFDWK